MKEKESQCWCPQRTPGDTLFPALFGLMRLADPLWVPEYRGSFQRWELGLITREGDGRDSDEKKDGLSDPGGGKPNRRGRRKQGGVTVVVPAREPVRQSVATRIHASDAPFCRNHRPCRRVNHGHQHAVAL